MSFPAATSCNAAYISSRSRSELNGLRFFRQHLPAERFINGPAEFPLLRFVQMDAVDSAGADDPGSVQEETTVHLRQLPVP